MKTIMRSVIFGSCILAITLFSRCGSSQPPVPPTITPPSLPNGTFGVPYSQPLEASGGVAPYHWALSAGTLPDKLQLVSSPTGETISGTPDAVAQAVAFSIKVTDSANQSATEPYTISIVPEPDTLSFVPAAGLTFAAQLVGTPSASQTATLSNSGSTSVVIFSVKPGGDFGDSTTCGSSLAAGSSCSISVTYTPSQPGPGNTYITVLDGTAGSPHYLPVSGTGVISGANATLSATSLNFGNQGVGTTGGPDSITLSNYGTTTLNVASIVLAGSGFGETDNCNGAPVAPGANCMLNVTFTPGTTGNFTGTLTLTDDALDSPQTVSLSGTGAVGHGHGYCIVSGNTLTGSCHHGRTEVKNCSNTLEPADCPVGATAIHKNLIVGDCVYVHTMTWVDTGRLCP